MGYDIFKQGLYEFVYTRYLDLRDTMIEFQGEFDTKFPEMVIYDGVFPSDIFIIGRDPGEQEVRKQKPFVGDSGMLLRNALAYAGVPSEKTFITNIVPFKPKDNKVFSQKVRDEFSTVVKLEIQVAKPKYVVTCGQEALESIIGKFGGGILRKCSDNLFIPKTIKIAGGIHTFNVVPLPHPSYFIRRGVTQNKFVENDEFNSLVISKLKKLADNTTLVQNISNDTKIKDNESKSTLRASSVFGKHISYQKESGIESKEIIMLDEDSKYIVGFDMNKLNEEHRGKFMDISSLIKSGDLNYAFRKYLKEKIVE